MWIAFVVLYFLTTVYAIFEAKFLFEGMLSAPLFWVVFVVLIASIVYIPVAVKSGKRGYSFLASAITIASMIGLMGISLFPRLVPSITDLSYSLTIYNASSTERTLTVMLIIALIGMPLVIGYTIFIYRAFKGKVILSEESY